MFDMYDISLQSSAVQQNGIVALQNHNANWRMICPSQNSVFQAPWKQWSLAVLTLFRLVPILSLLGMNESWPSCVMQKPACLVETLLCLLISNSGFTILRQKCVLWCELFVTAFCSRSLLCWYLAGSDSCRLSLLHWACQTSQRTHEVCGTQAAAFSITSVQ